MPPKTNSISGDEMTLRLHSPKFFQELIDSRTASLVEAGNPETLTAWKEERQQKDQLWQEMLQGNPNLQQQVLDQEVFEQSVRGFAQEFSKLSPNDIDQEVLEASIADILQNEMDPPWDNNAPPLDMRHVVAEQLDRHNQKERDDRDLADKSMSKQGAAIRNEFLLSEQQAIGKEVKAMQQKQENKLPPRKIDPPSNE